MLLFMVKMNGQEAARVESLLGFDFKVLMAKS
jgi:hypothetical protein